MCNDGPQRPLRIHSCSLDVILAQAFPSILFHLMLPLLQTFASCGKPAGVSLSLSPLIISSLGPLILQQPLPFLMCPLFSLIYSNCHAWDSLVRPLPPLNFSEQAENEI